MRMQRFMKWLCENAETKSRRLIEFSGYYKDIMKKCSVRKKWRSDSCTVLWEKQISNAGDSSRRISKMPYKVNQFPTEVKIPWRLGKCAMEKPSTNKLPGRSISLREGRNGRFPQFQKREPQQGGTRPQPSKEAKLFGQRSQSQAVTSQKSHMSNSSNTLLNWK